MHGSIQYKTEGGDEKSGTGLGRCLVEGDPEAVSRARRAQGKALGMSLALELGLLFVFVSAPLFTSASQPNLHHFQPPGLVFLGSWHATKPTRQVEPSTTLHFETVPHPFLPEALRGTSVRSQTDEPPTDALDLGALEQEVPEAILMGDVVIKRPAQPPPVEKPALPEKRPVKMNSTVLQAQLIWRVEPRYPPLAVQTRQEGTVVLHAIISRDGRITALEVTSGPPLLVQAALDAVRQWRYRPTILNGDPVEVETTITVVFRLQS